MKNKITPVLAKMPHRMGLHGWCAAAMLSCAAVLPALSVAAPPATGDAALNFVGADIESVIKAVGHYTNVTFIIDPRVKGTINLVSEKALTKAQAFGLLTSTLRLQGYTVVMGDGFAKVVPEADAKLQPGPLTVPPAAGSARGDQIATQIFQLNYEAANNLIPVLRPLISPNNTVNSNPGNNTLIVTDYADNLKRLGKIIAALDSPAATDLDVLPIRHAIASDIVAMVNKLLEPTGGETGRVNVVADARSNSVILRAPSLARANLAKSLIARLDQPTAQPGNVHVVYLKNADAMKLAQTLRAVVSSDGAAQTGSSNSSPAPAAPGLLPTAAASAAPGAQQTTLPSGGAAGFIQADSATNTLIITASEAVYRNLRAVIDQLDVRRAQVYIESLIVEVTSSKASEFGIQWLGLSGDKTSNYRVGAGTAYTSTGNNIVSQVASQASATKTFLPPGNGFTVGVFRQIGGQLGLGALAHALETDGNANILSTPNMITLDNEEAKIIVGQNVPFITGQFTTAASGGTAGVNPFQTIERKDVGLTLKVRPQISEGGTIRMSIFQESSSVDKSTLNAAAGVTTNKRSIETNVLADDGQIIVLGGLIEDSTSDGVDKVQGLGDLPVVGNLFKYQTRERKKTNLMVFLRPVVIRSSEQNSSLASDRYDYMRARELLAQPAAAAFLPDTGAPILPLLENGQPAGGSFARPLVPVRPANPANPAINGGSESPAGVPAKSTIR